jgi:Icc-related predicted phosphoesterase
MKILHVSDSHGQIPFYIKNHFDQLSDFDLIIHSGDFFDNGMHKPPHSQMFAYWEEKFQTEEVAKFGLSLVEWVKGKPFLYCAGNHDFNPNFIFEMNKIAEKKNFYNLTGYDHKVLETKISGFPYINFINGYWNYEIRNQEMLKDLFLDRIKNWMKNGFPDILVTHAPPFSILDGVKTNGHFGLQVLKDYLDGKLGNFPLPKAILCGHVHESHGTEIYNGVLISNAATTFHLLEV